MREGYTYDYIFDWNVQGYDTDTYHETKAARAQAGPKSDEDQGDEGEPREASDKNNEKSSKEGKDKKNRLSEI